MSSNTVPALILGASGYVGGEILRLLAFHPRLRVHAAVSRSAAGQLVADTFPHLRPGYPELRFSGTDALSEVERGEGPLAVFGAAPHGESAALLHELLLRAEAGPREVHLVDTSADYRLPDADLYAQVYEMEHGAPARIPDFHCGLPELEPETSGRYIAHPGCFTTAVTLACAPLQALGIAEPYYCVSAITGSTGSGRNPSATTHHPARHGNLRAYRPLYHRHVVEMEMLLGRLGGETPRVSFVPHSGPFARGIHVTVHVRLREPRSAFELRAAFDDFYRRAPLVSVADRPPDLKEVVGTQHCRLAVEARDREAVVFSVIDNLTRGAAGGAIQWMNRQLGFLETTGLELPALGWN